MDNNEMVITPNFRGLFDGFEREAKIKADTILADFDPPYSDDVLAWKNSQVSILRAIQGLLAPLNICAHAATSVADIERLRETMLRVLQTIAAKADKIEQELDELDAEVVLD